MLHTHLGSVNTPAAADPCLLCEQLNPITTMTEKCVVYSATEERKHPVRSCAFVSFFILMLMYGESFIEGRIQRSSLISHTLYSKHVSQGLGGLYFPLF